MRLHRVRQLVRSDPRVILVEGNARYLKSDWISETLDLVTVDVSFISLKKILPAVSNVLASGARCLVLVKPQFELGRGMVGKGGIVTNPDLHREAVASVVEAAEEVGLTHRDACPSPITGKEGNREFFVLFEKS